MADEEKVEETTEPTPPEEEEVIENPFNLKTELQKEKKYLRAGFLLYIAKNGYDVDTKRKFTIYMNKYKGA
ncbi:MULTISPECIES: hypothetical protein [Methanobacterium]|nr:MULTISPECIES: hypothetical protein [Methanobacterium]